MALPTDLLYTEEHEWIRREGDDVVTVGITEHAQEQLGSIVYVELPDDDSEVAKSDSLGQIESTKSVSDLYAPVSGQVIEVNAALEENPELINSAPYEDGWIVKLRLESSEELDELLSPQEYKDHVADA
ncbi:MAG: glycine cleavage system protein H [Myxococcales bacterium]|nr:glycine cleavage system protein H [Myxococcales bacterium]